MQRIKLQPSILPDLKPFCGISLSTSHLKGQVRYAFAILLLKKSCSLNVETVPQWAKANQQNQAYSPHIVLNTNKSIYKSSHPTLGNCSHCFVHFSSKNKNKKNLQININHQIQTFFEWTWQCPQRLLFINGNFVLISIQAISITTK